MQQPGDKLAIDREFTVYIVDDDHAVLKALTRLIATAGYAARPFASADEFIVAHDPELPGCAIVDILMPEHDGLEVQRVLRAAGRSVVFLTATAGTEQSAAAIKAGAVDVLTKPIDSARLFRAIERCQAQPASETSG